MDGVFKKRHSVRSFQDKQINPRDLDEILEAANSAPSAGNLKAREIVAVKDKETRRKIAEAALGQGFVAEAPIVLVFFAVPSRSAQRYGERGKSLYAVQDATISASFAWLQTVMLDLTSCWVGAFDEEEIKDILKADNKWKPIAILPIGYSAK